MKKPKSEARKPNGEQSRGEARSVLECGSLRPLSERAAPFQSAGGPARSKTWRDLVALLISVFSFQFSAFAQSYAINWSTIDGGGGTSTGGVHAVSGNIGQPDAGGPMTNGQYSVIGGFWALPQVVQTEGAPTLTIARGAPGFATISWTPASTNWVLQERASLTSGSWSNSISGSTNPIVVPAIVPVKYYRLFRP